MRGARAGADLPALRDRRALVAVDLGAESCRVSLLQAGDGVLQVRLVHRFANGPVTTAAGLRWPFPEIEAGIWDGLRQCAALAPEGIRAVAVDGWAVDYVRLGESGAAEELPYCYRDERTLAAEALVHARVPAERLRALTGIQVQRINTAYQLVADALAGASPARWLNLPEYTLYRLGARPVAELTNASHTQLLALGQARWCPEAFAALGLDAALAPPLVPPGTVVGKMKGQLGELAAFADTALIAPACHDTAAAIAGIPMEAGDQSWTYISSGSWSLVGTVLPAPENGPEARRANYTNLAAVGGPTLFHKGVPGMSLLRGCLRQWERDSGVIPDMPALLAEAESLPAPEWLLDLSDPALLGEGAMPARLAAQVAQRGGPQLGVGAEAAPEYASLIFHSLAACYAQLLREIAEMTGRDLKRVYVVGGGSRNALLNALVVRATGLEVRRGPAEASTQGNFAVQLALLEDGAATAEAVRRWACVLHACCGADGL